LKERPAARTVNQWIRTGGAFDTIVDFDAAVRDPKHPTQFREGYHCGDHLHRRATGYKAMVDAIDLSLFRHLAADPDARK
jgi:lysophospholipase L1-like esterase